MSLALTSFNLCGVLEKRRGVKWRRVSLTAKYTLKC